MSLFRPLFLLVILIGCASGLARADVTAMFPDVNRVAADYPDDVQRYVALNTLWDQLHAKSPSASDAIQKRATYYNASTAIRTQYINRPAAAGQDFDSQVARINTPDFERSVLQRYGVLDVTGDATPATTTAAGGDVTDAMIKNGFFMALPFGIGGVVAMYVVCHLLTRFTSAGSTVPSPPAIPVAGLPAFPESLRVVKVPGLTYTVEVHSGLAVDKETSVRTVTTTTTVPGQVQVVGNQVYANPAQSYTSSSSTKTDTFWVRLPDGREDSWSFTASDFQARPGHILSVLGRRLPDGKCHFMLAYNHTTGQLTSLPNNAHGVGGCLGAIAAFFIGTAAFALAIAIQMSIDRSFSTMNVVFLPFVYLIMGGIASLGVSTVIMMIVGSRITGRRNACFNRDYLPGIRNYFVSATPALQRLFGAA